MSSDSAKQATLYRMVMEKHRCPFGLKSLDLLKRQGYQVADHPLTSREDVDAFKKEHNVDTTPQVYIGDRHIGGYEELRKHFGKKVKSADETSYRPVIAVFCVAALLALAVSWMLDGELLTIRSGELFIAFSMSILALLKLQDVESFSSMFLNYDLLARRQVPYAYVYPYAELLAGVLMVAGALLWLAIPVALFIGTIGAVSVAKAVYIDKRELKCACVGGNSNVPLGFTSLTENLMMMAMGLWMLSYFF
ncbi:MauE/DoxX family redox-associated membrane protein [Halopseudomonas salegens]|uniref:Methylamine utilization protein MauE n=1 Tax=Halopseudomonas salegens TaxID=1434072 RepID=A0A1H2E856_9GAMM|nr:MauE/DoxX family redox-associated membrane protein [Halopseudomonas salegens]SDT91366.1 Glutaredoxin [Halopseudomonas salegens]